MGNQIPLGNHLRLGKGLAAGAVAAGAVLSLRALAKPLPTSERRLLDWDQVRRVAHARTGERGRPRVDRSGSRAAEYDAMAADLRPLMEGVWGPSTRAFPPFTVLDRRGFVDRNLVIVQRLFAPIERLRATVPESRITALTRVGMSRYVGELFGFLSSRVLGQYDPVLMLAPAGDEPDDATALYLVEPNVDGFAQRAGVQGESLRRWLVLHEVTHAWQFEEHPWLKEHIGALMNELLMNELTERIAGETTRRQRPAGVSLDILRTLPGTVRAQLRGAQRIQAVMSVCEGYSNFVMHRVGHEHLKDFDTLEAAFHRRSSQRPLLERLVMAVTGMNMKMRQYELGERFSDAVAAHGGLELLNRVWEGPASMPSMHELNHPQAWIRRMG